MMNPTLQALQELGGSATIEELYNKVAETMGLTDEQLEAIHNAERGSQTEADYRLAWTRSYLKNYGVIENSHRGIWALTPKGQQTPKLNPKDVIKFWKDQKKTAKKDREETVEEEEIEMTWKENLLRSLLKMKSDAFERLVQRMLRESGSFKWK